MNRRRSELPPHRRLHGYGSALALLCLGIMAINLVDPPITAAYEQYSLTRDAGNCADCHGSFRAGSYVSRNDNVPWGTSLHDGHRQTMLSGDCNACHFGSRFPVLLDQSDGGTGLSPISCAGCHGRAEPGAGNAVRGSGLRQHHDRNGVSVCRNCHSDANPAGFTPAPETVAPPYYFTPDAAHPNKPTEACDGNGSESVYGPIGLDNDGNNAYDSADGNCNPSAVGEDVAAGPALQLYWSGLATGFLRVSFTLPTGDAAMLEAFDVAGRMVARRDVGSLGPGRHLVDLASGRVPSGWYLLRLTQNGRVVTAKGVVMN